MQLMRVCPQPASRGIFSHTSMMMISSGGISRSMFKRHAMAGNRNTVAFGCISNIDGSGRKLMSMTVGPNPSQYPALLQMGMSPTGQQGMVFGRDVVDAIGLYSTRYKLCGDLDYWCKAMAAGFRFIFYPLEAGKFRVQDGQLSGDTETTRSELVQIAKVHFPKEASASEKLWAKLTYRLYNAPRYVQRIARWGFKSSYQLLESKAPNAAINAKWKSLFSTTMHPLLAALRASRSKALLRWLAAESR